MYKGYWYNFTLNLLFSLNEYRKNNKKNGQGIHYYISQHKRYAGNIFWNDLNLNNI